MGGSNSWLYLRQVTDLMAARDGPEERVKWTEPDFRGNDPLTGHLTLLERGEFRSITRDADENIGAEPYHRWGP